MLTQIESGSCWALGLLYSGAAGSSSPRDAAAHARDRIAKSYIDMDTLDALTNPPTNKVQYHIVVIDAS